MKASEAAKLASAAKSLRDEQAQLRRASAARTARLERQYQPHVEALNAHLSRLRCELLVSAVEGAMDHVVAAPAWNGLRTAIEQAAEAAEAIGKPVLELPAILTPLAGGNPGHVLPSSAILEVAGPKEAQLRGKLFEAVMSLDLPDIQQFRDFLTALQSQHHSLVDTGRARVREIGTRLSPAMRALFARHFSELLRWRRVNADYVDVLPIESIWVLWDPNEVLDTAEIAAMVRSCSQQIIYREIVQVSPPDTSGDPLRHPALLQWLATSGQEQVQAIFRAIEYSAENARMKCAIRVRHIEQESTLADDVKFGADCQNEVSSRWIPPGTEAVEGARLLASILEAHDYRTHVKRNRYLSTITVSW